MKSLNIVHISPTPLVAAPGKIAKAQRQVGHNAICIIFSDYPAHTNLAGKFIEDSILFTQELQKYLENSIAQADVIHIHNNCPYDKVKWILALNQEATFVYQIHSPMREGPVFLDRTEEIGLPFTKFLVVGQHHSKLYPNYIPVPNIIHSVPSLNLREKNEKLKVIYSPTNKHEGRWNNKFSATLDITLRSLKNLNLIEILSFEKPIPPNTLMYLRRNAHLTIDEIATGGFHQVSLEGLCAGNVVINGSDYFGQVGFSRFTNYVLPPFQTASDNDIQDVLLKFVDDVDLTRFWQQKSFEYFTQYLSPEKLVQFFIQAYGVA